MKKLLFLILLSIIGVVIIGGCEDQQSQKAGETGSVQKKPLPPLIVALGDSLTAGLGVELQDSYPSRLQEKLESDGQPFRVINAGVSGETSSGTLSRLDWILSQKPAIVILEIGANDGLRGIELSLVNDNIDRILQRLQDNGIVTILAGMKMVRNMGEQYTGRFDALYPQLAKKHDVIFMPFFLENVAAVASLNIGDGIHPNAEGYEIVTNNIYPYVLQAIGKLKGKSKKNN